MISSQAILGGSTKLPMRVAVYLSRKVTYQLVPYSVAEFNAVWRQVTDSTDQDPILPPSQESAGRDSDFAIRLRLVFGYGNHSGNRHGLSNCGMPFGGRP